MRIKFIIGGFSLLLLSVLATGFSFNLSRSTVALVGEGVPDVNSPGAPGAVYPQAARSRAADQAPLPMPSGDNHDDEHGSHSLPAVDLDSLMADSWPLRSHWFDEPHIVDAEHFESYSVPLELDHSCMSNATLDAQEDFSGHISKHYGQDTTLRDATDTFFKSIAQFFMFQDRFWQATVVWDYDMPPVYRAEFVSAADAAFENDVQLEQPPIEFLQSADAIAAQTWLDAMTQHYQSRGAMVASKIVEQRVIDADGKPHEWTAINGRVLTWQFSSGICVLNSSGSSARCACEKENNK